MTGVYVMSNFIKTKHPRSALALTKDG
ncbi:hypothetical protein EVA_13796, partial [gut metagenome]